MRRLFPAIALAAAWLTVLSTVAAAQVPSLPPTPPRTQWYASNEAQVGKGHWGNGTRMKVAEHCQDLVDEAARVECTLEDFRTRPFVVIAMIDSGINPYHQDFRAPEFTLHPSEYLEGFPEAAEAVDLSFAVADAQGYAAARTADADTLKALRGSTPASPKLYWFPGTRIIGGISFAGGGTVAGVTDYKVIDENGHGTGTASVAAGQFFGSSPNALIVEIEGLGQTGVAWANSQPWIDVVSNSWGPSLPGRADPPGTNLTHSRDAVRRGQSVLYSSGNGMYNTNSTAVFAPGPVPVDDPCDCKVPTHNSSTTASSSGPSWVITVGAASPVNGQAHWWHGIPNEAVSFGSKWRAAAHNGVTVSDSRDFGGTSAATPIVGGVLSALLLKARLELGDATSGQAGGIVASGPAGAVTSGPLADGSLTRQELEDLTLKTAAPVEFDPETYAWDYAVDPTTPLYYIDQGYGVVDRTSKARSEAVLMGGAQLPARAEVDQWIAVTDRAREAQWGAR